ncbi:hypothetical protein, partial [Nocardioides sp.]|uniref:hypothetical protein n=1 Tax=Nocardioides sp. TaxID=35761 RepID=UPI002733DFB2
MSRVPRPSPALLVAFVALCIAMSGTAYAAGKIHGKDIKRNTITSKQLKNNSVKSKHVKNGTLRAVDLQPGLLGAKSLPRKRVIATP